MLSVIFSGKFLSPYIHFTVVFTIFLIVTEDKLKILGLHEELGSRFTDKELRDETQGLTDKLLTLRELNVFLVERIIKPSFGRFHTVNDREVSDDHVSQFLPRLLC